MEPKTATHVTHFSTDVVSKHERFEFWYSLMNQRGTAISMDIEKDIQFSGKGKMVPLDNFLITHLVNSENSVLRTQKHITQDSDLFYLIHMPLQNGLTLISEQETQTVAAGSLVIMNTEFPLKAVQQGKNLISLKVPVKELPEININKAFVVFQPQQLPGYLTRLFINAAYESFSSPLSPEEQQQTKHQLIDALTALINHSVGKSTYMKQYFFVQICQLISRKFASGLQLEDVAKELKISKVYIHKILSANQTSFRQLIAQEKLKRSLSHLLLKDKHFTRISDIATKVGFNNDSHFSTSFKKQFQCTPLKFYQMFKV